MIRSALPLLFHLVMHPPEPERGHEKPGNAGLVFWRLMIFLFLHNKAFHKLGVEIPIPEIFILHQL